MRPRRGRQKAFTVEKWRTWLDREHVDAQTRAKLAPGVQDFRDRCSAADIKFTAVFGDKVRP